MRLKIAQLYLVSAGRLMLGLLSFIWNYGKSVLNHKIWEQKLSTTDVLSYFIVKMPVLAFYLKETIC